MFRRVRLRLVAVNAVVFFLILSVFGAVLYGYMQHRLFAQVDNLLRTRSPYSFQDATPGTMPFFGHWNSADQDQTTLPTIFLLWDTGGHLVGQFPETFFVQNQLGSLSHHLTPSRPWTTRVDHHYFRVITFQMEQQLLAGPNMTGTLQVLRNVDREVEMLHDLRVVILFGIALGGMVAVLAGLFLANRAFIPIRRSWDKQQQFVSDASHELRTPLAAVQAQAELLLHHPDHTVEEESQPISAIYHEARRMSKLVDQLLTLARSGSNQLQIQPEATLLDQVVTDVVNQLRPLCELKQVTLEAECPDPVPCEVDKERFHQLLLILLDNALKYTPEHGQIRIACSRHGRMVNLSVQDTGEGIATEDLPLVFDRFYRGDKVRTNSDGGVGLGLSIAKWIVEAHGGKIAVESKIAEGTTVRVTLRATRQPDRDG